MPDHILVVEDDPDLARFLRSALEPGFGDIVVAENGNIAFDAVRGNVPRMVIASVAVPGMDGYHLCRAIRELPLHAELPVILLADRVDEATVALGLEAGADGFLCPPFEEARLLSRVQQVLSTAARRCHSVQSQKMEAIGRLAGNVAHDFNNTLQVIQGFTDYVLAKTPVTDALHKPLVEIRKASEKAAALTQQLLALSGRQAQSLEALDLGPVVGRTPVMLRQVVGEKVAVEFRVQSGLWKVNVDQGHIEQALVSLAASIRAATEAGGVLTIEAQNLVLGPNRLDDDWETAKPGEYVCLVVRDNGTGMSRETREHVFEPFFSAEGNDKGTGLGLATVYGIVKQAGGSIRCRGEAGKGTTYVILLPRIGEVTS